VQVDNVRARTLSTLAHETPLVPRTLDAPAGCPLSRPAVSRARAGFLVLSQMAERPNAPDRESGVALCSSDTVATASSNLALGPYGGVGQLGVPAGLITLRSVVQIHSPLLRGVYGFESRWGGEVAL
jgi:hypothetical protein